MGKKQNANLNPIYVETLASITPHWEGSKYHLEGEGGVRNLARLTNCVTGDRDSLYFGQFQGGCFGDLIVFFGNNPGAMDAVVDWLKDNYSDEIQELIDEEEEEEEADDE